MKREPSLHIKESDLVKVLDKLFFVEGSPIKWDTKELAKNILKRGKKYALQDRKILEKSAKSDRHIKKSILSGGEDAHLFASTLLMCRRKAKHRGIALIKDTSKDWFIVKEVTSLANNFCEEFGFSKKEGYRVYVNLALSKMSKFGLIKFNSMHESICLDYESELVIRDDPHPDKTSIAHDVYNNLLAEYGSAPQNWKRRPDKYKAFIELVDLCKSNNIPLEPFVRAQFMGLEFTKSIPDPLQLVNEKAMDRWVKYAVKAKEASPEKPERVVKINFKMIRDAKNRDRQS